MKKFLYLLMVALMAVGFVACSSAGDVAKFTIGFTDQKGSTVLTLTPDYSNRTFAVDYKKDSTDKTQKSVTATGQMGGESFDRFNAMSKVVKNYKPAVVDPKLPVDATKPKLKAVVETIKNVTSTMEVQTDDISPEVQDVKAFYNDVVKLLTESTPV